MEFTTIIALINLVLGAVIFTVGVIGLLNRFGVLS